MRNLITDVAGVSVGNAHDARLRSGVTVLLTAEPAVAAVDVRGGGPGTRETDALAPTGTVEHVHGICLSGGSAFGLDAASGVQSWLAERGRGFPVGPARVPIVPAAILFDLLNGGDKSWGRHPPYRELAYAACDAAGAEFALGTAGAGYGASTATLVGGLGSASARTADGVSVGALVAVNAAGSVTLGEGPHFWAAPFEVGSEYGGLGFPAQPGADSLALRLKGGPAQSTTIAVVATDAVLTRNEALRVAVMAQTGLARAIYPVHAPLDGDTVFVVATGKRPLADGLFGLSRLGAAAADVLSRAVARGVYEATGFGDGRLASWKERFGR